MSLPDLCGLVETGSGVNIPGSSDSDEQVAVLQRIVNLVHVKRHLAKPDDMRAQIASRSAAAAVGVEIEIIADIKNQS